MTAYFDNTVSILVKAFLEGTLLKGDCHACAVGNICAVAIGNKVDVSYFQHAQQSSEHMRGKAMWRTASSRYSTPTWINLFCTTSDGQHKSFTLEAARQRDSYLVDDEFFDGRIQLVATGYTVEQLARIEFAFETAAPGYTEEAEFAGLLAVVDVLADIHGVDLSTAEAAKLLFVHA